MTTNPPYNRFRHTVATAVLLAVTVLIPACSPPLPDTPKVEGVSGTVLVKDKPAVGAVVTFHPTDAAGQNKPRPRGVVQADGTFKLTSYSTGDGAAAGEYAVTLQWPEPIDPDQEARGVEAKDRLNNRYRNPDRPYKRVTVRAGNNELEPFNLP